MKRVHAFALAAALVAASPAVAHALGDIAPTGRVAPPPRAEEAEPARPGGEPVADDAEEHGPKPINWFDLSNKEQPPYGVMVLNFAILMAMYYALGKKPVAEALTARRASVAKEIEEAQKMRHEAEARAVKYQEKLRHLEVELGEMRDSLRASGEVERDRIVREAEEKATRMEKDARFLVDQELKQMRGELTRDAIELAVAAAEEMLRKRITSADQERLAEDYLSQLGGRRPGGAQDTPPPLAGAES
jgi:F0F1-type ATP synthase membrane subunit b/b'